MWLLEDSMKAPSGEGSGAICAGHEELVRLLTFINGLWVMVFGLWVTMVWIIVYVGSRLILFSHVTAPSLDTLCFPFLYISTFFQILNSFILTSLFISLFNQVGELEGEVEWQHSHDWRLYPEYGKGYGGTGLELCGQRDGYVRRRREEEKKRGREEERKRCKRHSSRAACRSLR